MNNIMCNISQEKTTLTGLGAPTGFFVPTLSLSA